MMSQTPVIVTLREDSELAYCLGFRVYEGRILCTPIDYKHYRRWPGRHGSDPNPGMGESEYATPEQIDMLRRKMTELAANPRWPDHVGAWGYPALAAAVGLGDLFPAR